MAPNISVTRDTFPDRAVVLLIWIFGVPDVVQMYVMFAVAAKRFHDSCVFEIVRVAVCPAGGFPPQGHFALV